MDGEVALLYCGFEAVGYWEEVFGDVGCCWYRVLVGLVVEEMIAEPSNVYPDSKYLIPQSLLEYFRSSVGV